MRWIVLLLVLPALAGCTGSESTPTGTLTLSILDTSRETVDMVAEGAWGLTAGDDAGWYRFVEGNETWTLTSSGQAIPVSGLGPAGDYQGIRLALSAVHRGSQEAILVENGFDIPVDFSLVEDGETVIEVGLAWTDALFDSADGLAFRPAVNSLRIIEGGVETLALEAQDIEVGGSKPPVARMRVFDATGLEVFESDFVAESLETPVIANVGNLTFAGAGSEAIQPGTEIASYLWEFDDGTSLEGVTVTKEILEASNQTVRLTVTDSVGATDSQSLQIAMRPPTEPVLFPTEISGTVIGVDANCAGGPTGPPIDHVFPVDPTTMPDGSAGLLIGVSGALAGPAVLSLALDADVDLIDAAGTVLDSGTSLGMNEEVEVTYEPGAAIAAGDWTLHIRPCIAGVAPYTGEIVLSYLPITDPDYFFWVLGFDDGHDHQH